MPLRTDWLAQKDECGRLIGEYEGEGETDEEEEDEKAEEGEVGDARLEQTGLVVVVAVERLVLQLATACNADAILLINEDDLEAALPFCNLADAPLLDRAASTVDRLLCSEVDTWLVDRFDPFALFPMVKPGVPPVD